jgi:hypothetical protein
MLSVRLLQTEPSSEDVLLSSSAIRIAIGTDLLVAVNSDDGNAVAGILHGLPKGEFERKDSVSLQRPNNVEIGRNYKSLVTSRLGERRSIWLLKPVTTTQ